MKSIKKILFIMAALAATLAFVSCSNGDDDDDGPSTVAVYKGTDEDDITVTITFYNDDTWKMVAEYKGEVVNSGNGTYKGDPTKDGTIDVTAKKMTAMYPSTGEIFDVPVDDYNGKMEIKDGEADFNEMNFKRKQ